MYSKYTTAEGATTERRRERVHLLLAIVATALVFHLDTSELIVDADGNTG